MRKSLLAMSLSMLALGVSAQSANYGLPKEVDIVLEDYDYNLLGSGGTTTLSYDEETEVFTLADFCNSGVPVSFTVQKDDTQDYFNLSFKDAAYESGYYVYLSGGKVSTYLNIYPVPAEGSELPDYVDMTIVVNSKGSTYAQLNYAYDDGTIGNFISIRLTGYTRDSEIVPDFYASISWLDSDSGLEGAVVGDSEAPVEYYNLQGVRVSSPAAGQVYIRRQGSEVSKVRL